MGLWYRYGIYGDEQSAAVLVYRNVIVVTSNHTFNLVRLQWPAFNPD